MYLHTEVWAKYSACEGASSQTRNAFMILKSSVGPTGIALLRSKWGKSEADGFNFVKFLQQDYRIRT